MTAHSLSSLAEETRALAERARSALFHVPSPAGGRSALGFDGKLLLVPALEAEGGEELELLAPGGRPARAAVRGFDPGRGLAVLELAEALPETALEPAPGLPRLGDILLAAAFPSPQGPEVRLDLVRFAGGEGEEAYIQTDGASFPGFSGGALLSPESRLAGVILADRPGNRSWAIPAELARGLLAEIAEAGVPRTAYLGLSSLAVDIPPGLAASFGEGRTEALLVLGVEAGLAAEKAGVLPGDFLLSIGGRAVSGPRELEAALALARPGKELKIEVLRGGRQLSLEALPGEAPRGRARLRRGAWGRRGWAPGRWAGCGPSG